MQAIQTATAARARDGHLATWAAIGLAAGTIPAVALLAGLPMRYVVYGTLGAAALAVTPYLLLASGSMMRLLWLSLILSLQLELAYAPIVWGFQKLSGPYGLLISPTLLISSAVLVLAALMGSLRPTRRRQVPRSLLVASFVFFAAGLTSCLRTPDRTLSAFGLFEIISLVITALAGLVCARSRNGVRILYSGFLAILFVQSATIIVEQVVGIQFSLSQGTSASYQWGGDHAGRFAGTFGAPSVAATFIAVALYLVSTRLLSRERTRAARPLGILFGLGFLALLLTRTRSAWIGFAIGAAGLARHAYKEGRLSRHDIARLIVVASVSLMLAWPLVQQRLAADHADDANIRTNLMKIAAHMIAANPLLGVGINTATNQVYKYAAEINIDTWVYIVHNQFLLVAVETGLPGLAGFLAVFAIGLRAAHRSMRSHDPLVRETASALFWSLVMLTWALSLDHVSGCKTYFLVWFIVGVSCGLEDYVREAAGDLDTEPPVRRLKTLRPVLSAPS